MNKTLAAVAALLTISSSAFAALPPVSSHRVHVNPSQRMHTSTGNRVRMTPTHGELGPIGGRMSSTARVSHHGGPASVHVGPPPGPSPIRPRDDRNYVRPSLPPHRYYYPVVPPPPPLRWRYAGYYGRPCPVWYGYPVACYGYPYSLYYGRYYARPGIRVSVII